MMNRQMHKWWADAFFALKCLGITPQSEEESTIQLQFHWMPRSAIGKGKGKKRSREESDHWDRAINLDNREGKRMVEDWKEKIRLGKPEVQVSGGIVSATDAASSQLLHSGWLPTTLRR